MPSRPAFRPRRARQGLRVTGTGGRGRYEILDVPQMGEHLDGKRRGRLGGCTSYHRKAAGVAIGRGRDLDPAPMHAALRSMLGARKKKQISLDARRRPQR